MIGNSVALQLVLQQRQLTGTKDSTVVGSVAGGSFRAALRDGKREGLG